MTLINTQTLSIEIKKKSYNDELGLILKHKISTFVLFYDR